MISNWRIFASWARFLSENKFIVNLLSFSDFSADKFHISKITKIIFLGFLLDNSSPTMEGVVGLNPPSPCAIFLRGGGGLMSQASRKIEREMWKVRFWERIYFSAMLEDCWRELRKILQFLVRCREGEFWVLSVNPSRRCIRRGVCFWVGQQSSINLMASEC